MTWTPNLLEVRMMATHTTTQTTSLTARMAVAVLTLMAGVAAGCGGSGPHAPLTPEVLRGEAAHVQPQRVLALSASCGSVEFPCPDAYVKTVDEIVRSSMDFIGYALVQPDKLLGMPVLGLSGRIGPGIGNTIVHGE